MRRTSVNDWRTVQLFLSPRQPAVFEVEMNLEDATARCNCPTYKGRSVCRHTKFVVARLESNNGHYPLMVHENSQADDLTSVMTTGKKFRDFVVKYGRIEVL